MQISSDTKFIFITATLVAVLGAGAVADVLSIEEKSTLVRGPASIAQIVSENSEMINFDCATDNITSNAAAAKNEVHSVRGSLLRLQGRGCGVKFDAQRLKILNESNGFTAAVFQKQKSKYETDLIQLNKGVNLIRFEYLSDSHQNRKPIYKILSVTSLQI
jgi:hypothetical protein